MRWVLALIILITFVKVWAGLYSGAETRAVVIEALVGLLVFIGALGVIKLSERNGKS